MTIKVIIRYFCKLCGEQVFRISDDDVWRCQKCQKDFFRGNLREDKEIIVC